MNVARRAQSVQRLATGGTVRRSNSGEGEVFRTHPRLNPRPTQLPEEWKSCPYPGVKWTGYGLHCPPPTSSAEVEEKVEL